MGRFDHDDPRDEHDINELRNFVHKGTKPQFAGKPGKGGGFCSLTLLALIAAPIVATVLAVRGLG